jgi:hypothetical protein
MVKRKRRCDAPLPGCDGFLIQGLGVEYFVYFGREIGFSAKAHDLIYDLSVFEEDEIGNAHHAVLHGDVLILIHIALHDFEPSGITLRNSIENGREHFARLAPLGPKIHHNGL